MNNLMMSCFMLLAILLTSCVAPPTPIPTEPSPGGWQTWVIKDIAAAHPAAPPAAQTTQAEVQEMKGLINQLTAEDMTQIAYWDSGSPSYRWIEIAFAQNRAKPSPAPSVTRMMSLLNVAIYDALVVAWDAQYSFNRARPAKLSPGLSVLSQQTDSPSYPSEHATAAGAAAAVLGYIYPDQAQDFLDKAQAAAHSRVLAGANYPSDVAAGLELGKSIAQQVIARMQGDDSLPAWDGVMPTGAGHWTGEKPVEPNAGKWQPWTLASQDEFLSTPPLAHDSPELAVELQEIKSFTRTFASTQKAMWWQTADGVFENWYNFASLRLFEQGLDANAVESARIYARMSVAQHDALIACWNAKYTYWYFRPVQLDPTVTTVFPTPNYPSYPSGHACASTAISEVIAAEFPASAEAIRAKAAEAYESRIWAGIHFRHEMVAGKEIGLAVAQKVLAQGE